MTPFTAILLATFIATPLPLLAESFSPVSKKSDFVALITGKALTRFGISIDLSPGGTIKGRAFGSPVTGAWQWQNGLFCRDLYFGTKDLGPNCQTVKRKGNTLRFTSDAGKGTSADLQLK